MIKRTIKHLLKAKDGIDGAGVKMRSVSPSDYSLLDPFVEVDEVESNNPEDFFAGFPPHPHRGSEFLTYIRKGEMRHSDSLGNTGHLKNGDMQYMCSGSGALHSEMPAPNKQGLHVFQLWINLPQSHKLCEPWYVDMRSEESPTVDSTNVKAVLLVGELCLEGKTVSKQLGESEAAKRSSRKTVADLSINANKKVELTLPKSHKAMVYVHSGQLKIAGQNIKKNELAILSSGEELEIICQRQKAGCLIMVGEPLNEPVVRGGPFVMNSEAEIQKAFADYQSGKFGQV
tara:strand:+ start:84 stop:944 length:861 start_codon:yes stop_codon:yes gene_type:complete